MVFLVYAVMMTIRPSGARPSGRGVPLPAATTAPHNGNGTAPFEPGSPAYPANALEGVEPPALS